MSARNHIIDPADTEEDLADGVGRLLVESNPLSWASDYGFIRLKSAKIVPLAANPLQEKVGEIMGYMLQHKLPVRILIYKPRQKGSSTWSMGCLKWWLDRFGGKGYLCGNELSNCRNLWDILRVYADNDNYDWGHSCEVLAQSAKFGNGAGAFWATAKNAESGRSATITALVMTEIARWAEDDQAVRDAGKVFSSLMGAVPKLPETLVIAETTVRGGSGVFKEQWDQAKSFEDLKAGRYEYGDFIQVFLPWFVFADSVLPTTPDEAANILSGIGAVNEQEALRERDLVRRYGLTAGHIKYWRMRLRECDNDPEERDREEPTTPESGFYAAEPSFFSKSRLAAMRREAEELQTRVRAGSLEWNEAKDSVSWVTVPADERPLWMLFEKPAYGHRYIMGADNSRGIEIDTGKTDQHAPVMVRLGYTDRATGQWVRPAVVAAMRSNVRCDIDILADEIAKAAQWYGGCMVVPEANNDGGLIKFLRDMGVHVFERKRPATDKEDEKPTGKYGVWTADDGQGRGIRSEMLGDLRRTIRLGPEEGEGILVPFLHILDELETFIIDSKTGKAQAQAKKHDDFVMALSFANYFKGQATTNRPPKAETQLPADMLKALREERYRGGKLTARGAHSV